MKGLNYPEIKAVSPQPLSVLFPLPFFPQETWHAYCTRYRLSTDQVPAIKLIYFSNRGDLKNLREIIEHQHINVNSQVLPGFGNFKQRAALHYAQNSQIVTYLASKGADLNLRDEIGRSPLIRAVLDNNEDVVKRLLELGAKPDIEDKLGETAQTLAAGMVMQACSVRSFASNLKMEVSQDILLCQSCLKILNRMNLLLENKKLAMKKNETNPITPNSEMESLVSIIEKIHHLIIKIEHLREKIISKNNFVNLLIYRFRETNIPALIAQAQWDREQQTLEQKKISQTSAKPIGNTQGINLSDNLFIFLPEDNKISAHQRQKRKLETQKELTYFSP
ncbi:MAG: ankyrin repeat domain-containing protein [Proteobacteria bacterium]|nr:ankyrin repeat domain-containing protein [Pseudomonadota bacterium]